jgi:hypothetical protein
MFYHREKPTPQTCFLALPAVLDLGRTHPKAQEKQDLLKLDVLYGTNATRATETVFFFVLPWQLLICLAVIFIIVFWGGKKLIRRYNRHIIQKARLGMNTPNGANHV